ncbi:S8 family serine peptidase [Actinospongicola halichondriae]|uniref:S8 family serine peptidase n=1 Tax=Actinospongicola halichondriae TaxID=3236844 RepID=UPI003D52CEDC
MGKSRYWRMTRPLVGWVAVVMALLAATMLAPLPASAAPPPSLRDVPVDVEAQSPDRTPIGLPRSTPSRIPASEEPTSVVVEFERGAVAASAAESVGGEVRMRIADTDSVVIDTDGRNAEEVAAELEARPDVVRAEPNGIVSASDTPNDPRYSDQSAAFDQIRLGDAWRIETGSPSVVVAVLDSGVDAGHPDLVGRIVPGYNAFDGTADTADDFGHGTLVAGVIAAKRDNGIGVAGVAGGGAMIMPVKVLDSFGDGTDATVASGIRWAAEHGADVINLSLSRLGTSETIDDAVTFALDHDVVVVAATGNDAVNAPSVPAGSPGVVGVASTDSDGNFSWFSTYGFQVDLTAPGMGITSTEAGGGYATEDGTSFAAPLVAGAAALIRSRHPGYDESRTRLALLRGAEDRGPAGVDDSYGFGVLDVAASLGVLGYEPIGSVQAPEVDPEPNDLPVLASETTATNSGSIQVEGDVDWWRIEVAEASMVRATVIPTEFDPERAAAFDPVIEAFGVEGHSIGITDARYTGEDETVEFVSGPGTALVSVRNFHGSTSGGPYDLRVDVVPPEPIEWQPPEDVTQGTDSGAYFESSPGDVVGLGAAYSYDLTDAVFTPLLRDLQGRSGFSVNIDGTDDWDLRFTFPDWLTTLVSANYPYLARDPFGREALGALTVDGPGSGCNEVAADMTVDQATVGDGAVQSFELRFRYRCEETGPPLYGWIRWRADETPSPPGYTPDPGDLWHPEPSAVPDDGTAAFFQSDPGAWVGKGREWGYSKSDASFVFTTRAHGLHAQIHGFEKWDVNLQLPGDLGVLPGLVEIQSGNPTRASLSLSAESAACGDAVGWAVIDDIESDGEGLRFAEFRFAVRCGDDSPEERGWIRWDRDDPTVPPGYLDVPGGLWSPAPGSVPEAGSVVLFDISGAGEGAGESHVFTPGTGQFEHHVGDRTVDIRVRDEANKLWIATVHGPSHLPLMEGYLPELQQRVAHNPTRGGLWLQIPELVDCHGGVAWAVIDDLEADASLVTSLIARFEHPCGDDGPLVRGFIRLEGDVLTSSGIQQRTVGGPRSEGQPTEPARVSAATVVDEAAENDGPWLLHSTPAPRATVDPTTGLRLTFGRFVRDSSIDDQTVVLLDGITGSPIPATLETHRHGDTTSVVIRPDAPLSSGMAYVIGVGGIRDVTSGTMPTTWVPFTTTGRPFPNPDIGEHFDPLVGDFNGDVADDVLLYQPGGATDLTLFGSRETFHVRQTTVNGTYEPFTVDLNGDGFDDIHWYRPGSGADYIWYGSSDGFRSVPTTVTGTYEPFSLDLNGDGFEDILWYAPGGAADYIWYGRADGFRSVRTTVNGTYQPVTLDLDGDGFEDILWYAPGGAADYIWYGRADGFRSVRTTVNGTYRPVAGDFDGDGYDDITWYRPGRGADFVWWGSTGGFRSEQVTINGTYRPSAGDFNGDGYDDLLLYGVGSDPDFLHFGGLSGHL